MICEVIQNEYNEWEVQPVSGLFRGQVIAVCEGISLRDVRVVEGVIQGKPWAVWGAVLNDDITTSKETLEGLGIGRAFPHGCFGALLTLKGGLLHTEGRGKPKISMKNLVVFKKGIFRGGPVLRPATGGGARVVTSVELVSA